MSDYQTIREEERGDRGGIKFFLPEVQVVFAVRRLAVANLEKKIPVEMKGGGGL